MKNSGSEYYDSGILSTPLSFLRDGYFAWGYAGLGSHGEGGRYWLSRSSNPTYSSSLTFNNGGLGSQDANTRAFGHAVRCVAIFQILHHSH